MSLYGLLGEKLGHSYSPQIHKNVFKYLNMEGCYHLFEVEKDNLKDALNGLKTLNASGVNVTIPYKVQIMEYLDYISSKAKRIGSVNTISFSNGKTVGYNTDYYGFGMMLLKNEIDIKNRRAVILGTGGAAKSVIQYLLDNKIKEITLVSRNPDKSKINFSEFNIISYNDVKHLSNESVLINCTPCGMYPNTKVSPITRKEITRFEVAVDLIYNPTETELLKYAKLEGLKYANGLYMLVGQAIKAQEIWNDIEIKKEVIDKVYNIVQLNISGDNI